MGRGLVEGKLLFQIALGSQDAVALHELDSSGDDALGDDLRDRVGCRLEVVERHQQINPELGQGQQPQGDLGHHGQGAL